MRDLWWRSCVVLAAAWNLGADSSVTSSAPDDDRSEASVVSRRLSHRSPGLLSLFGSSSPHGHERSNGVRAEDDQHASPDGAAVLARFGATKAATAAEPSAPLPSKEQRGSGSDVASAAVTSVAPLSPPQPSVVGAGQPKRVRVKRLPSLPVAIVSGPDSQVGALPSSPLDALIASGASDTATGQCCGRGLSWDEA